jgi:peptidase M50-like protein
MHTFRKNLSWVFIFISLVCLQIAVSSMLAANHRHHSLLLFRYFLAPFIFTMMAAVHGVAWWTIWKNKPSARIWGLAASLINLLISVGLIYLSRSPRRLWLVLGVGIAGLIAFWRRYDQPASTTTTQGLMRIPGDGTNDLLNRSIQLLMFGVSFAAYLWWTRWLTTNNIDLSPGTLQRTAMIMLVLLAVTILHEFGHAATGLAVGMKLRAFIIGPLHWQIRDGKWEFQFKPSAFLAAGGATGVVPATLNLPRRNFLCMLTAGSLVNLLTGFLALWVASSTNPDSPLQAKGLLALFGAWSLILGAMNLLPFRTSNNYSDGAKLYQLLSDGPWGDFHKAVAMSGSSLVTPLRPRDYDIEALQRAARTITRGHQGLLLQLFAHNCFLDQGKTREAGEVLRSAESIYHESALDISAELHSVFVFGSAFVFRDAAAAREWWGRMESKKPRRFNVDYWRADGALHWIEGNLKTANEALAKSETLAEKLPQAGAYDFDRYCCSLLRKALDETLAPEASPVLADAHPANS